MIQAIRRLWWRWTGRSFATWDDPTGQRTTDTTLRVRHALLMREVAACLNRWNGPVFDTREPHNTMARLVGSVAVVLIDTSYEAVRKVHGDVQGRRWLLEVHEHIRKLVEDASGGPERELLPDDGPVPPAGGTEAPRG